MPVVVFEPPVFTRYQTDGLTYGNFRYEIIAKYPNGNPVTNEAVTWQISRGTIIDYHDHTNGSGYAEIRINFVQETPPVTITATVLGTSNSSSNPTIYIKISTTGVCYRKCLCRLLSQRNISEFDFIIVRGA